MSFNVIRPIRHVTDPDLLSGPAGKTDSLMLQSGGGTDRILHSNDSKLLQSNGDEILLSPNTTTEFMLQSGGTDKVLISGGTDRLLIRGYSSLLNGGNYIRLSNV